MLKLTLMTKSSNQIKRQVAYLRQNPDLLENGVVDNSGTWAPNPANGNGSGHVRIMNPVELKAVCAKAPASHPLTSSTFQKRKTSNAAAPAASKPVDEDPYMGFTLQALGR